MHGPLESCTRRTVLAGAVATLAFGASAGAASAAKVARAAVDVHHHFLPPFYKPLAKPWFDKFATGVSAVLAWTPEASLAAMDEANVSRAVLSISSPGVHFGDDAQAGELARQANDYALALRKTHPGRFEFAEDGDYADYTGPFIVVHGHTISDQPEVKHNRIGVDTGAFMTGRLTAVELRGDQLRFITAIGPSVPWGVY